jgi:hypothetical protein
LRTSLLVLLILINYKLIISQSTNQYFNNNQVWHVESTCHYTYDCMTKQVFVFYAQGDTAIGSFLYKKIYNKRISSFTGYMFTPCFSPMFGPYPPYPLYLRSQGKKIYTRIYSKDTLMYDFNLQIGDTLPFTYNNPDDFSGVPKIVTYIDSFNTSIGYLKKIQINYFGYLIEGAGWVGGEYAGFINNYWECGNELKCYSVNDTSYYPTVGGLACFTNVGLNELTINNNFKIHPNPANDVLNIDLFDFNNDLYSIDVLNELGQVVLQETINTEHSTLKTQGLTKGIYFLRIKTFKGILNGKFVKE